MAEEEIKEEPENNEASMAGDAAAEQVAEAPGEVEVPAEMGEVPIPKPSFAQRAGFIAKSLGNTAVSATEGLFNPDGDAESPTIEANGDDLSDLFEVPDEDDLDVSVDDLTEIDSEDDLSDLFDVTNEDIVEGHDSRRDARHKVAKRARQLRRNLPPNMGGIG